MTRYQQNLNVLTQLKNGAYPQDLLKRYTGWGGLRKAIYTPEIYREIKKCLTPDEITSLKKTLRSAYYTPQEIVCFMYRFLTLQGFKGGNILEPSVGTGVFIEHMPEALRKNSQITAVEIDIVTSRICRKLYPDINVHTQGFEMFNPAQGYDLIIGNPPYGSQVLFDARHSDLKDYRIHHYFTAKSMRLLKQGGILAMVLPSYVMDNESQHVRNIIDAEGGTLIAAYRLPDDLFEDAKVTIDLVFLKKAKMSNAPAWLKVNKKLVSGYGMYLNEYYGQNPEHIIGRLEVIDLYGRKGLTCKKDSEHPFEKLNALIVSRPNAEAILSELKAHVGFLCQELGRLSQAFALTMEKLESLQQKISVLDTKS